MMTSDMTDRTTLHDGPDPLDAYFSAGRAQAPELGAALRASILDAASAARKPRPARLGVLRRWVSGWALPGFAGGATAALIGLWVGFAVPMPVVALDAPDWMHEALSYVDMITMPLIGPGDPMVLGF